MKNKITLLALFFISASVIANAQVVPNANMELWTHHTGYDDPNSWSTPNGLTGIFSIYEVFKDSLNVNSGQYAAKLVNKSVPGFGTVPGAMGTGTIDIANASFNGGFPLSDSLVTAITGYYKYSPVGSDTAFIYALLFHWNSALSKRDTVAALTFLGGAAANYTFFGVPFVVLIPGEAPDSAIIIVSAAFNVGAAQAGSTLWLDDIDFTNSVGISPVQNVSLNLYPNPADESLRLTLSPDLHAHSILVSNVAGTIVKQMQVTSSEMNINTTPFAQGTYVMHVKNEEGTIVASGKFAVNH